MLASRAVEARERLGDVPVWLDACEAFASSMGFRHELAHIDLVRSGYERLAGRMDEARRLAERALPVFRQAGDFRCAMRTVLEIAEHHLAGDPVAAAALLTRGAAIASVAGDAGLGRRILAGLAAAAAAAGDLPLGARALGALEAVSGQPSGDAGSPQVPEDIARTLRTRPARRSSRRAGPAGSG